MIERAITWALRSGVRKGVAGGSGPWLVIAVVAGVMKLARRPPRNAHPVRLTIRPGEQYIVRVEEPSR